MDAIYIGMAAPVWQIEKTIFFPVSLAHRAPIMGVNRGDLKRGAMAAYACSRYDTGLQAARLVQKIFNGIAPADIPVETPDDWSSSSIVGLWNGSAFHCPDGYGDWPMKW